MKARQTLKDCPLFAGLSDSELDKIADLGVETEHEAGAAIFREGDPAESLFVLQEGKVAVQIKVPADRIQPSKRVTVDIVNRNEVLGGSTVVEASVHANSAVCLQKTRLFAINGAKLRSLLQQDHHTGFEVVKGLARVVSSRLADTRLLLVSERSWLP